MTIQEKNTSSPLNEAEQVKLMQDIVMLLENPGHGKEFTLTLVKADCYNPIRISVPVGVEMEAKVLVTFPSYPATSSPTVKPRGGVQSAMVASIVMSRLQRNTSSSVSLHDVVVLVQEVGNGLARLETGEVNEIASLVVRQQEILRIPTKTLSPRGTTIIPIVTLVLASAILAMTAVSMTLALSLAMTAFCVAGLLLSWQSLPTKPPLSTKDTMPDSKLETNSYPVSQGDLPEKTSPQAELRQQISKCNLLSVQGRQVFLLEPLLDSILADFSHYAPNEYAFLCSGIVTSDGLAFVTGYYPGEMQVSTPVYCELTEAFLQQTIYYDIPKDHNLIVWGHVHPIGVPSGTDKQTFRDLAAWDYEMAERGYMVKRSIGMLVNMHGNRVSFYDTHSHERIAHTLLPMEGKNNGQ